MLLDKIIDLATDIHQPLSVLLRQCVVLAHQLSNDSLKMWANQELNGYTDSKNLPEYRIMRAGALGVFRAGYAFPSITRPIPPSAMEKPHRWAAETVRLTEPVSAYENCLQSPKGHALMYEWNADLIGYYQSSFIEGHALARAWQEVPFSAIAGVLDTIRTRVLNVALDIKKEIGESDSDLKKVELNPKEAEKVNHIVINHIYGGTVFVGSEQQIRIQNIAVGNWNDLNKALLAAGIGESEIGELSGAIQQDEQRIGTGVKAWISKNASKVLNKGVEMGATLGTTILTEYVKRHLGIA